MPQDVAGYEILQRWSPVPIATGEALYTAQDFKTLLDRRAVDVVQPDLTLCGGFWQGRIIAALAGLHHVRVSPHVWGSGIGLAAGVHFVAALPSLPHAGNVPKPPLVSMTWGRTRCGRRCCGSRSGRWRGGSRCRTRRGWASRSTGTPSSGMRCIESPSENATAAVIRRSFSVLRS